MSEGKSDFVRKKLEFSPNKNSFSFEQNLRYIRGRFFDIAVCLKLNSFLRIFFLRACSVFPGYDISINKTLNLDVMKLLIFSFFAALLAYSLLFSPSHKDNYAQEDRALFLVGDTLSFNSMRVE